MALLTISSKSTGNITTDGTTYLKAKVNKCGDRSLSGVTILLKYTKGDETGITVTQSGIFPVISATDIYQMPSGLSGTLSIATWSLVGSGNWQLPIAVQPYGEIYLVFAKDGGTPTGTIIADLIYDTEDGNH